MNARKWLLKETGYRKDGMNREILHDHYPKVDLSFLNFQDNHEAKGRIIREGPK